MKRNYWILIGALSLQSCVLISDPSIAELQAASCVRSAIANDPLVHDAGDAHTIAGMEITFRFEDEDGVTHEMIRIVGIPLPDSFDYVSSLSDYPELDERIAEKCHGHRAR